MIWGVTGTRHGATPYQLASVAWLFSRYGIKGMNNGDAIGVDKQLYYLGRSFINSVTLHPPGNARYRAWVGDNKDEFRNPLPYHERDRNIVDESEALVSVQWKAVEVPGGTKYTTDYARSLNRPIVIVWPNGHTSYENWTLEKL